MADLRLETSVADPESDLLYDLLLRGEPPPDEYLLEIDENDERYGNRVTL